jgi:hypothetical protein
MTLQKIVKILDNDIEISVVAGRKYIYVCKNNGQHHKGDCDGIASFASFIGKFEAGDPWITSKIDLLSAS